MTSLDPQRMYSMLYLLLWISRVRGFQRRWQQPRLRGPEWFLDTPVQPGFYEGPGPALLRRYAWRMTLPCLIDVIALAGYSITHHSVWLLIAPLVLSPAVHLNHLLNVAYSQREARSWAVSEETRPVAAVGFSLVPRRLRDYTNPVVEVAFAVLTVASFAVLWYLYRTLPERHNPRLVFGTPAMYLYVQGGLLLIKRAIVAWRAPVPLVQSSEHVEIRETMRRYYLLMCDWVRISVVAGTAFWPILLTVPQRFFLPLSRSWGALWLLLCIAGAIWIEVRRKQLLTLRLKARPVRLPDLSGTREAARWPVCWQPGIPMLVLRNEWGYSINLGNTSTFLGMAYLAGMAALLFIVRR